MGVVAVVYCGRKTIGDNNILVRELVNDGVMEGDVLELDTIELPLDAQVIVDKRDKYNSFVGQKIYDNGVITWFDDTQTVEKLHTTFDFSDGHVDNKNGQIVGRLADDRVKLLHALIDQIDGCVEFNGSGNLTVYNNRGGTCRMSDNQVSPDGGRRNVIDFCLTADCRDIVTEYISSVADHQPLQERVVATIYTKTRDLGQLGEVVAFAYTRDDWDGIFGDGITSLIAYNKAGEAIRFYQGNWQVHSLSFADDKLYVFVYEFETDIHISGEGNMAVYEFDLSRNDYTPRKVASINDWSYVCENVFYCMEYCGFPVLDDLYVREGKLYFAGGEPWIYGETTDDNWQHRRFVLDLSQSEYLDDAQVVESYRQSDYWLSDNERLFRIDNESKVAAGQTIGNLDTRTIGDLYYQSNGRDILLADKIATKSDRFDYCWPYGFELNGYVFFRSGGRSISRMHIASEKTELVYVVPDRYMVECLHNRVNALEVGLRDVYSNEQETVYVSYDGELLPGGLRELNGESASLTNQNVDDWLRYGYSVPDDSIRGPFYLSEN